MRGLGKLRDRKIKTTSILVDTDLVSIASWNHVSKLKNCTCKVMYSEPPLQARMSMEPMFTPIAWVWLR